MGFKAFAGNLESKLFFLVILFLPTQLGKHFWPDFSLIYSLKIDYLSPTLYFWDILLLLLGVVWVVSKARVNNRAVTLVLFFLLGQVLSLFGAENLGAGVVRLWQIFIVCVFGVYIASKSWSFIRRPLGQGLLIGILFESFLAICQFLLGRDMGLWIFGERAFGLSTPMIATFNFYGQVFLRPYGTTSHPNVLAAYFVLAIPLLSLVVRKSYLKYLAVTVGFMACLLTFSRGAILMLVAEGFFIFRSRMKFLVLGVIIALPFLFVRFESAFNFDNLSIIRREELALFAIAQFRDSPINGIGLNNSINRIASSDLVSGPSRFLQPVHNIFLLTLLETGILGLLGFLGLIGHPFYKLAREGSLLSTLFLVIFFLGMFDHYFLTLPQGQRILFLIWGVAMLELNNGGNYKKSI